MIRKNGHWQVILLVSMLGANVVADEPERPPVAFAQPQNQDTLLEFAKRHQIQTVDQAAAVLELRSPSVLAWTNPTRGDTFGGIFLWVDGERPLAYGGMFVWRDATSQKLGREFHSLTSQPLVAQFDGQPIWSPGSDGLTFHQLSVADGASEWNGFRRLRQFKQFAKRFGVTIIDSVEDREKTRLLPTPLYRYADSKSGIIDGVIFAFVQGTDPEALLVIELHSQNSGEPEWRYAVARCTTMALDIELDEETVDSRPRYNYSRPDSTAAFLAVPRMTIK